MNIKKHILIIKTVAFVIIGSCIGKDHITII